MSQLPPSLVELAGRFGIATEYQDWSGRRVDVEESTVVAVLAALGVAASDDSGIVHDLAVGLHPDGADSWALQDALALGVAAGAPPDEFNQLGQDWSQPPWRPDRLDELEYRPFPALIRGVLRHAGGVRIDHIIGLFRLWWIPQDEAPTQARTCATTTRR